MTRQKIRDKAMPISIPKTRRPTNSNTDAEAEKTRFMSLLFYLACPARYFVSEASFDVPDSQKKNV